MKLHSKLHWCVRCSTALCRPLLLRPYAIEGSASNFAMGSGDTVCKEAYKDSKFPRSQEAQHDAKVDQCEEALTGAHIPQCENPQGGALDMTTNWTDTTSQCQDYNISDDGLPCAHDGICSCGGFSQRKTHFP